MQSEITFCDCCLMTLTTEVPVFALRALGSHQADGVGYFTVAVQYKSMVSAQWQASRYIELMQN